MSRKEIEELRALVYGRFPFRRPGAPEPELIGEFAPLLSKRLIRTALRTLGGIGILTQPERARIERSLFERVFRVKNRDWILRRAIEWPRLVKLLPDPLPAKLLDFIRLSGYASNALPALRRLANRLPDTQVGEAMIQATLAAARNLQANSDMYHRDLVGSLKQIPLKLAANERDLLLRAAYGVEGYFLIEYRAEALTDLLPHIDDASLFRQVVDEILAVAEQLHESGKIARILVRLSLQLPTNEGEPLIRRALELARSETWDQQRLDALMQIYNHCDEPWRGQALDQIHTLEIGLTDLRFYRVEPLEPFTDLISSWIEFALNAPESRPALELTPLATRLPEELLPKAIRVARASAEEDSPRARLLISLLPRLAEDQIPAALEAARDFKKPRSRRRALLALQSVLPDEERRSLEREVPSIPGDRIRQLLQKLPKKRRYAILENAIRTIRQDYQVGYYGPAPGLEMLPDGGAVAPELDSLPSNQERSVNTGFSPLENPAEPLQAEFPLQTAQSYYFWLQIDRRLPGAIDLQPAALPEERLPAEAPIQVVLYGYPGEIILDPDQDRGEIQLGADGSARVTLQAGQPEQLQDTQLLDRRLFFPVRMPPTSGTFRLRCNLYFRQVLIQSHRVEAQVTSGAPDGTARDTVPALRTRADYTLSNTLRRDQLEPITSHQFCLLMNDNGDGSHGFRFFGSQSERSLKSEAAFSDQELQSLIEKARREMRRATWGDPQPWTGQPYRYAGEPDLGRLRVDLVNFARWGYRFYDAIVNRLAAGGGARPAEIRSHVRRLREIMQQPGMIQLALRENARKLIPLALVYDLPLDTTLPAQRYQLCSEFRTSLEQAGQIETQRCFRDRCANADQDDVICPSGFWGFRHAIGIPLSVGEGWSDAVPMLHYAHVPSLSVAVSTDPGLTLRAAHEGCLQRLQERLSWQYADNRKDTIDMMLANRSAVLYFYCHGGSLDDIPYIQVGSPQEHVITRDLLRSRDIFWERYQPLVFINGCETTALEPEIALDLVTGFVETCNAAGVIGTEVTVFEPLATAFAESCLKHFLQGVPIGEAVRRSRLALLRQGNPLGLVYVPFVLASLSLSSQER